MIPTFKLPSPLARLALAGALAAALPATLTGCGDGPGHPKEISAKEVGTGVAEIFKSATPETRQLAVDIAAAVEKQDFTTAWDKLQTLAQQPGLTDAQKEFLASSTAAVGAEVNKAEASGDEAAKAALEFHRANK